MSKDIAEFRGTVDKLGDEFVKTLPAHITADKFIRMTMNAIQAAPELLEKDRRTLLGSIMKAAQTGLLIDGRESALVTFGNAVQFMPMVAGLMKLVRNSNEIESISTGIVHAGDTFEHWTDDQGEHFKHVPNYDGSRGDENLAYAFVKTKDGGKYLEVMDREAIEKVRNVSRAKTSGPWKEWWGEMARKTVFRRLAKRLPMSTDRERFDAAIRADNEFYDVHGQTVTHIRPPKPTPTRPRALESIAGSQAMDAALAEDAPPAATGTETGVF